MGNFKKSMKQRNRKLSEKKTRMLNQAINKQKKKRKKNSTPK